MIELIERIEDWAEMRGIFAKSDPKTQMLKCVSEIGELADAVAKGDEEMIVDGVGDTLVTLILLCKMKGYTLEMCLESAYEEIKNRKGSMQNGIFVKEVIDTKTIDAFSYNGC